VSAWQTLENKNIVVVRTDRIGDTVLSLPFAGFLKKFFNCRVYFVCSPYTEPLVKSCQFIDMVITPESIKIKDIPNDAILFFLYPDRKIMHILRKSGNLRIATAHRWYSYLYANKRVWFSRKRSPLHESQLNFFLLKGAGINYIPSRYEIPTYSGFRIHKGKFKEKMGNYIVVHPFSGGHTTEWGLHNFSLLIDTILNEFTHINVVVIGTKEEKEKIIFKKHSNLFDMRGEISLEDLPDIMSDAILFIGNSSGPLHVASLCGCPIIGFFPPITHLSSSRWGPLSQPSISIQPPRCRHCSEKTTCECLQKIPPNNVMSKIKELINQISRK